MIDINLYLIFQTQKPWKKAKFMIGALHVVLTMNSHTPIFHNFDFNAQCEQQKLFQLKSYCEGYIENMYDAKFIVAGSDVVVITCQEPSITMEDEATMEVNEPCSHAICFDVTFVKNNQCGCNKWQ